MNPRLKSYIFSLTLWAFCQGSLHLFLFGFFGGFFGGGAKLASEIPTFPTCFHSLNPASYLFLQLQGEPVKVKTKAEEPIEVKTSSFFTGINYFLKTHKGQQKDGTVGTVTGQLMVTPPWSVFLAPSPSWLRVFLSQRRSLQCLPSG